MKTQWMTQQNHKELLIFFCGWGQDPKPFQNISSAIFDVLIIYEYSNIASHKIPDITQYTKIHVIAWSMGVWVAQYYFQDLLKRAQSTIAINGTTQPIDDHFGIPKAIYQGTLDAFSEKNRDRFFMRMCGGASGIKKYHKPERTLESQQQELAYLQEEVNRHDVDGAPAFQYAIMSKQDLIIPTENQKAYWQQHPKVHCQTIPGAHYIFDQWETWEQLHTLAVNSHDR